MGSFELINGNQSDKWDALARSFTNYVMRWITKKKRLSRIIIHKFLEEYNIVLYCVFVTK